MRRPAWALMVLLVALMVASCAGTSSSTQGGNDQITIGFSQHRVAGSDWYKHLIQGAKSQARKQGAEILVADAGGDAVQQASDIRTFMTKGVDGVVVNALDPRGMGGVFGELKEGGTPFVAVNSKLSGDYHKMAYCFVAEDQVAAAAKAGRELAEKVSKQSGSNQEVKLGIVGGYSGEVTTSLRKKGFLKGYNGYMNSHSEPGTTMLPIRYGHWLPDQALQPVQQMATANPSMQALFSMSDVMLPGIEQGLRRGGNLNGITIVSYDGAMSTIKKMMEHPNGPVQATVSNTPYLQGAAAVQMAINAVKGEPASSACPEGTHHTPSVLITTDNAEGYYNPSLGPYYYPKEAVRELD